MRVAGYRVKMIGRLALVQIGVAMREGAVNGAPCYGRRYGIEIEV